MPPGRGRRLVEVLAGQDTSPARRRHLQGGGLARSSLRTRLVFPHAEQHVDAVQEAPVPPDPARAARVPVFVRRLIAEETDPTREVIEAAPARVAQNNIEVDDTMAQATQSWQTGASADQGQRWGTSTTVPPCEPNL